MGDPRNPARADEKWNPKRIAAQEWEIRTLSDLIILSGGWAWHFLSPPHEELKLHHDHKDIDVFVKPEHAAELFGVFDCLGYSHVSTIYDSKPPSDHPAAKLYREFQRYEYHAEWEGEHVKITFDVFIGDLTSLEVDGIRVVDPKVLLSMYRAKAHTTDDCTAVIAARELLTKGVEILKNPELVRRRV
jgi:hypothetical protein